MRYTLITIGLFSAVLGTAACSATGSPYAPIRPVGVDQTVTGDASVASILAGPVSGPLQAPWPHSVAAPPSRTLGAGVDRGIACPPDRVFVADYFNSSIDVFPAHNPLRPKPCGYITQGVLGPSGISVGQDGTLYVSDYQFNAISEYPRNSSRPSRKFFTAGKPQYAYIGSDGTVYVSEAYSNQVEEFAPGAKKPERTISITYPWGVATDSSNNLYVTSDVYNGSSYVGHIVEFAPGSTTGTDLGIMIGFELGITIAKDNSIVVGDGGNVDVFPPGATTPSRSFPTVGPFDINFDEHEKRLFVASSVRGGGVGIYDFKTGALLGTMTGFLEPDGVALDPPAPY